MAYGTSAFSTGGKFRPVLNFNLTLVAHSYALL